MTIPDGLADYLATREAQRNQQIDDAHDALTDREQALVREASVMGYVQGVMAARDTPRPTIPPDETVLRLVIAACIANSDLYPHIADRLEGETS